MEPLDFILMWYSIHCNDEWEHQFGISINTLDNPGWVCRIDLIGTVLENASFDCVLDGETDENYDAMGNALGPWMNCRVNEEKQFEITCGPLDLLRGLRVFQAWAVSVNPEWATRS